MLLDTFLLAVGLAIIYYGAEYLVKGAANVAMILGVRPIIVGLTVVAFGTSAPELVASLIAVYRGSADIALGNVIGSNIANIGLVLAVGAVIYPLKVNSLTVKQELPIMIAFTLVLLLFCYNGVISRLDGAVLFLGLILFTVYCVIRALRHGREERRLAREARAEINGKDRLVLELVVTVAGVVGVIAGAYLLIDSAVSIARTLGVSELVIGVTVVAVGTSLPELATTAVAAFRRHSDIAVGNIIGSNIFNIGLILGVTALAHPLMVARDIFVKEMMIMTAFSVALAFMAMRLEIGRAAGAALLLGYSVFIYLMVVFRVAG